MALYNFKDKTPKIKETVFLAQSADIIGDVEIDEDSSVWYGAVLRADFEKISIGKNSNIQDGAIIHTAHDAPVNIGDNVTIGHGANIHACTIGNSCVIGIGAIVLDGAVIKDNSLVAAGAVVTPGKVFEKNSFLMGTPATLKKTFTDEEAQNLESFSNIYLELSKDYQGSNRLR